MADGIMHIKWAARPVLALSNSRKALAFLFYICCRYVASQSWRITVKVLQIWLVRIESGSHVPSLPSNDHHVHCSGLISSVDKAIYGIWTGRWRTRWTQALGEVQVWGKVLYWIGNKARCYWVNCLLPESGYVICTVFEYDTLIWMSICIYNIKHLCDCAYDLCIRAFIHISYPATEIACHDVPSVSSSLGQVGSWVLRLMLMYIQSHPHASIEAWTSRFLIVPSSAKGNAASQNTAVVVLYEPCLGLCDHQALHPKMKMTQKIEVEIACKMISPKIV